MCNFEEKVEMLVKYGEEVCDPIREKMEQCLDGRKPLPKKVRSHIEGCFLCREVWYSIRSHSPDCEHPFVTKTDPAFFKVLVINFISDPEGRGPLKENILKHLETCYLCQEMLRNLAQNLGLFIAALPKEIKSKI